MDNSFLDKVIDQLVSETSRDSKDCKLYTPFFPPLHFLFEPIHYTSFTDHCKEVYGMEDHREIYYVWEKYESIIKNIL